MTNPPPAPSPEAQALTLVHLSVVIDEYFRDLQDRVPLEQHIYVPRAQIRQELATFANHIEDLTRQLATERQRSAEGHAAHAASFSALNAIAQLLGMDGLVEYEEVVRRADAMVQALATERARLDWLESKTSPTPVKMHDQELYETSTTISWKDWNENLRDTIDAARQAEGRVG